MSPYRILTSQPVAGSLRHKRVLSAMLSVDKITQARNVYVIEKAIPLDAKVPITSKYVAHMQSTKKNSIILAKYTIELEHMPRRCYIVRDDSTQQVISPSEYTQSDCLVAAMHDFCAKNGITIVSVL